MDNRDVVTMERSALVELQAEREGFKLAYKAALKEIHALHVAESTLCQERDALRVALGRAGERINCYREWTEREAIASRRNPVLMEILKDARTLADDIRTALTFRSAVEGA
jgi:hypothetical protein